jgi:hypothetical protein
MNEVDGYDAFIRIRFATTHCYREHRCKKLDLSKVYYSTNFYVLLGKDLDIKKGENCK